MTNGLNNFISFAKLHHHDVTFLAECKQSHQWNNQAKSVNHEDGKHFFCSIAENGCFFPISVMNSTPPLGRQAKGLYR